MKAKYISEAEMNNKVEELLAAIGSELSHNRSEYYDKLLDGTAEGYPLFYSNEKSAIPNRGIHSKGTISRKTRRRILLIAAIILILLLIAMGVYAVKYTPFNAMFVERNNHTEVHWTQPDESIAEKEYSKIELGYIPEGYEIISEEAEGAWIHTVLGNGKDEYINVSAWVTAQTKMYIDNETLIRQEIELGTKKAILFSDSQGNYIEVDWQIDNYTVEIAAMNSTEEEILLIAKRIKLIE